VDEEILESHGYLDQAPDRYLDLEHAMAELPVIYREVIVLRFFEEWKIEEIATILELPVSTVKSRLYHALKLLRINLEE
jgi:RNA polymerase sigma-70 factor (ECF subfamily)